ncbi:MAG TPA: MopE-related protein, partial [Chitinophagaceae bacterium]|nr:MopE-related protein [Chitinophagaceae bacterium]
EFNLTDNEASLQLNPMSVSLQSLSVSCFGNSDGQIQATVTGGQAPYYVEWSTGQTGNPVQVPAGTYTVTVTDINGLQATAVDSVTQPALLQAIENYLPIACYGDPVLIQVSATGGTPPYSGTGILNAFAGTQNITVIDTVGCTSVLNFFISQPDSLQVNEVHQDASCNNLQDAEINISVLGGTAPYSYSWSTSAVSQDIENIGEGTYGLNVTDDLGCTKAIQVQIQSMALATIWYVDQDGDGYGSPMQFVWSCLPPAGFVADSSDCNDLVATTHPGAGEICGNGIDDNCNGIVDEGCTQPCNLQVDIITTGPTTVCAPTCVMLHAQSTGAYGGVTYTWHSLTDVVPTVDACVSGWYKVSVSDSNACHASDSVYIEVHPQPSCTITPLAAVNYPVVNSNNNSLCATVFGATNYTWSLTSSNNSWYIQGSTHNLCVNYHCGSMASSATFTLLATSADGCVSSPCIYTLSPEAHEVCSYTQGFYGNSNGQLTCIGKTAACAVKQALGWNNACNAISACNPIVVGYGNTRKITIGCSEASCVTAKLPAGNTASVLPTGGPWNCSNVPSSLLQNGRFKNVLLGQTIALSINLRLFPALANLHITNSCFSTWQSADCDPNSNNVVANSMLNFSIPQSVINCLGSNPNNNKVGNLLNLANLALAGQPYGCAASGGGCGNSAPDLSDITAALDAINKGFDRCRIISGYNVRMNSSSGGDENLIFRYFPNPTNGETTIEFESPVDALAELQLLNMDGSKINTLFHQEVEAGESYTGSFNAGTLAPGLYLLRLKVGE